MDEIPSNYNLPYSKLKEYLSGWLETVEEDRKLNEASRVREIKSKLHPEETLFSHTYDGKSKFTDSTIVGTNEITDYYLSMMINQLIGFDIQLGEYNPAEPVK